MTKLLERAIAEIRRLPDDRQDEAAEILLEIVGQDSEDYQLSSLQRAEVRRRLQEPSDLATDEEAEEVFKRLLK